MLNWFRCALKRTRSATPAVGFRSRPRFEVLEDRTTPTASAIAANFNSIAVPAGDSLWFSSAAKVSGVPADGATVRISKATITAPALGTVNVPDATIRFDPNATAVSASFDGTGWQITSPVQYSGNIFVDGVPVALPNGLPGGIQGVVWSGDFTADQAGLSLNWQWAAAAYTRLSADPAALGVKPTDALSLQYLNLDRAGTPENFKLRVTGGARGSGLLNYTGSYTGSTSVSPELPAPQATASISGHVNFNHNIGQQSATLSLLLRQDDGSWIPVDSTTSDAATGNYSFANLAAGTYRIVLAPPPAPDGYYYVQTRASAGAIGDSQDTGSTAQGETIVGISLGSGDSGTEYDFLIYYTTTG